MRTFQQHQLIFVCLLAFLGWAQPQQAQGLDDQIYLRDGSYLRGTVTEHKAGEYLRIRTAEGEVRQIEEGDIHKASIAGEKTRLKKPLLTLNQSGYFNHSSFGLLMGGGGYDRSVHPSFHTINGYQLKGRYQFGVGAGLETFNYRAYLPFFLDTKYFFRQQDVSPFVGVSAGYAVSTYNDNDRRGWEYAPQEKDFGGAMAGFEVGVRNMTKGNFGMTFSAGYRLQMLRFLENRYFWNGVNSVPYQVSERWQMHRFVLRIGLTFN